MTGAATGAAPAATAHPAVSLRSRLLSLLLAPLGVLLFAGLLVDYVADVGPLRHADDAALTASAVALAGYYAGAGLREESLPPDARRALKLDTPSGRMFAVRDAAGVWLTGDAGLPEATGPANPALADATVLGVRLRLATFHSASSGRSLSVTVAETMASRGRVTRYLVLTTVTLAVLQLVAILFLVWLAVRRGLEPLLRVEGRLAARSARELEPLDEQAVPEEVRGLVRSLNELFTRVRASAEAQQAFLANAAHQLRTPLTGMLAQLELLARDASATAVGERIAALHEATRRLSHTANQLLTLARAEASATTPRDFEAVELQALAAELVAGELDRALARGLDLGLDAESVTVTGVAWLLRELLANLLDNALAYTPSGGTVTVRVGRDGRTGYLEVVDDGPGIPAEARPRVLERFYRPPGASGAGSGLGLAIVADVARVHGAQLTLDAGQGGRGLRVRVSFALPD